MIPRPFEYHVPRTLPEAIALLGELGDEAKLLAGGHSLLPMMKLRFAEPGHLIDLGKLSELKGIREVAGEIRIGAMTTHAEVASSPAVKQAIPALAAERFARASAATRSPSRSVGRKPKRSGRCRQ